ncbi:hypothetical protein RUM43_003557 [Polyplax serrata]|uniref:Uncharacterized protein n=1 Tax=Polyplax serrata TaxID=468196 RepID=A0AAN8S6J2_POLSC
MRAETDLWLLPPRSVECKEEPQHPCTPPAVDTSVASYDTQCIDKLLGCFKQIREFQNHNSTPEIQDVIPSRENTQSDLDTRKEKRPKTKATEFAVHYFNYFLAFVFFFEILLAHKNTCNFPRVLISSTAAYKVPEEREH